MVKLAIDCRDLDVYQISMGAAMKVYELSKQLPYRERFPMTDQMTRSSRSVCADLSEAWRKRRYPKAFVAAINIAEGEASETRVWLEFAYRCGYLSKDNFDLLDDRFDYISRVLHRMSRSPDKWISYRI
ncbi:MAG: four helix bundle protein [bacterium]|nr:four helix bundle protein [bacterium]MDT8367213.1 four helix bundle protein [bacterium]